MRNLRGWCLALAAACSFAGATSAEEKPAPVKLFDGKTLAGWKSTQFGGEGEVKVENGAILLPRGQSMTGITYDGKEETLPKSNYELSLEAMRVDGSDFFCGLTFPVKDSHCSFIVGGWGGGVVGLSSVDNHDASENETSSLKTFENKKWHTIRVRVLDDSIQCWINDERVVSQETKGHTFSTRSEVVLNKPLGVATWETSGAIRNFQLTPVSAVAK